MDGKGFIFLADETTEAGHLIQLGCGCGCGGGVGKLTLTLTPFWPFPSLFVHSFFTYAHRDPEATTKTKTRNKYVHPT